MIDWSIRSTLNARLDQVDTRLVPEIFTQIFTDYSIDFYGGEITKIFNLDNRRTAIMNWYIRYKIELNQRYNRIIISTYRWISSDWSDTIFSRSQFWCIHIFSSIKSVCQFKCTQSVFSSYNMCNMCAVIADTSVKENLWWDKSRLFEYII